MRILNLFCDRFRFIWIFVFVLLTGCEDQVMVFTSTRSDNLVITDFPVYTESSAVDSQVNMTIVPTTTGGHLALTTTEVYYSNDVALTEVTSNITATSNVKLLSTDVLEMTASAVATNTNIPTMTMTNIVTSTDLQVINPTNTLTPSPTLTPTQLPTPDKYGNKRTARVPILMYHYIEPLSDDADNIRRGLTVEPGVFRQQLAYLHAKDYTAISLYDLTYFLAVGSDLPEKPIIFCFDDGYVGLYEYALPSMEAFGYTGTVFVLTQLMDEAHSSYLTWDMAHSMYDKGWKIEPHSKMHVQLSDRPFEVVQYQVLGSMQTVEAHIGIQPRYFSYPSGAYDQQVIDYLKALGFWGAVTTEYGMEHTIQSVYTLSRIRMSNYTTIELLSKYLDEQ